MTVYAIAQLKMTDRAAYDRYQARFFMCSGSTAGGFSRPTNSPACSKALGPMTNLS
ncbi:hypothetical protein ACVMII_004800 [Bradyrhizobium diazoefficiens]